MIIRNVKERFCIYVCSMKGIRWLVYILYRFMLIDEVIILKKWKLIRNYVYEIKYYIKFEIMIILNLKSFCLNVFI